MSDYQIARDSRCSHARNGAQRQSSIVTSGAVNFDGRLCASKFYFIASWNNILNDDVKS